MKNKNLLVQKKYLVKGETKLLNRLAPIRNLYQNRLRFAIVIDVARVCGMFWAARAVCVALIIELIVT